MKICVYSAVLMLFQLSCGQQIHYDLTNSEDLQRNSRHQDLPGNLRRLGGQIRFEDDARYPDSDDLSNVSLDEPSQPFSFHESPGNGRVTFQDDNRIEDPTNNNFDLDQGNREKPTPVTFKDDNRIPGPNIKKRRRRKRRKPRYQSPGQYNPQGFLPGQYPGTPGPLGQGQYPGPNPPLGQGNVGYPAQPYPALGQAFGPDGRPIPQYYRPPRRRKQSFASETLTRVVGALTSIALYDDYQCVPRLLCEAAGGGTLGTSSVLDSIAGLQPLLTLLAAYNGISSSPLFVFGRAVFLGMTAKGNTGSCRYAYPQCPTDPEQLVHYLNNHNGGFFRFFNSPQPQIPQNLEQFYNQLSGQYGLQNPGPQQYGFYEQGPIQQNGPQQNYGLYNPQLNPVPQQYGLQPYPQNVNTPGPTHGNYQQNPNPYQGNYQSFPGNQYGLYSNQLSGHQSQNLYANQYNYINQQSSGSKYPYVGKYGLSNIRYKDKTGKTLKIEKRIQNKPSYLYVDSNIGNVDVDSKWIFPEHTENNDNTLNASDNIRGGKNLKFPEDDYKTIDTNDDGRRKGKSILFPENQTTRYVNNYGDPSGQNNDIYKYGYLNNNAATAAINNYEYNYNDYVNNGRDKRYKLNNIYSKYMYSNEDDVGLQTVYIVRGNGDPNNPEIVKIRPGEKIML